MVVVEGVARSLDPHMNIWKVAQPVVEDYIKVSIGPRAAASDFWKTAQVLARFGPRLPALVESALIKHSTPATPPTQRRWTSRALWGSVGFAVALILVAAVDVLL